MTILLTGADGFAGAHVLDYLLTETDSDVVCLIRSEPRRLPHILERHDPSRVRLVSHDLTTQVPDAVDDAIGDVDTVFSLASSTNIAGSVADPRSVFLPNVELIANLADWARGRDLDSFVHLSSEEVYGPAPAAPHLEWEPIRPSTHYSASKAAQEAYLIASWRSHGLPLILLNLMNLIGPMQDPSKLVPTIIRKTLRGERVPLLVDWYEPQSGSGGESLRSYMHPRVAASAALHTRTDPKRHWNPKATLPPRYNVAGEQVGNVALATMVAEAMGQNLNWKPVSSDAARPGHERVFALDDSLLRSTGWTPPTTLARDVEDTVAWTLGHREWLR